MLDLLNFSVVVHVSKVGQRYMTCQNVRCTTFRGCAEVTKFRRLLVKTDRSPNAAAANHDRSFVDSMPWAYAL